VEKAVLMVHFLIDDAPISNCNTGRENCPLVICVYGPGHRKKAKEGEKNYENDSKATRDKP
jgi:hypothetical protein